MNNRIIHGDCLEVMQEIPDGSIDMVLCDLPYGTTRNNWDSVIPFYALWNSYERVVKDDGAIVLTSSQPFTSALVMSNTILFKYTWTWDKVNKWSGFLNAKKQPIRIVEDICVFYKNQCLYNPQKRQGKPYSAKSIGGKSDNYGSQKDVATENNGDYYPVNLISIKGDNRGVEGRIHPTQKPVALFEYLIKTYTNEGDTVLDNCAGSMTTAIAAINTNRHYICIEKDADYYAKGCERVKNHVKQYELL